MLKKIRYKFIAIAMLTITIVTFGIFSIILIDTYARLNKQGDKLIDVIIENNGKIPEYTEKSSTNATDFNKETRFQTRFFVIVTDDNYKIINTNTNYVASVTNDDAENIIDELQEENKNILKKFFNEIQNKKSQSGFYKIYKYKMTKNADGNNLIIFLDMAKEIGSFRDLLYKGMIIVISGLIIVFVFVSIFSKKIMKPIEENIEKQKEFITDAGHELKTPVAVILANIDVLEMTQDVKNNEWIASIKNQALRLDRLIKSLLKLSRLEERSITSEKETFSITQLINDEINIDRLFDRFYRDDKSRNKKKEGYGIGLSVAKSIVNLYKGKILANKKENNVINFKIILNDVVVQETNSN